jgi:transcription termination factor Rho
MTAIAEETTTSTEEQSTAISGVVDLVDGRGFLRVAGYRRSADDIPITQAQVRQHGLRAGDHIDGTAGTRRGSTPQNKARQDKPPAKDKPPLKDRALLTVEFVNGLPAAEVRHRPDFDDLTPVYPNQRFRLEDGDPSRTARIIDLVSPIGKGQRGLIVSPPKAGKTMVLQAIANAIATNNPEVHLMVVLVDERPEEVTDMQRSVKGEVIASTFDQPAEDHTIVAELAIERAKRLAELGQDVVVCSTRSPGSAAPTTSPPRLRTHHVRRCGLDRALPAEASSSARPATSSTAAR